MTEFIKKPLSKREIFLLITMVIAIGLLALASFFFKGNLSAMIWTYSFFAIYVAYAVITNDSLLKRFLLMAMVAGFTELIADAWAVGTGTLVYPTNQPMIWASPLYMPFSWVVVFTQIGNIAFIIAERLKHPVWSGLIMLLLGAMLVPFYEILAIRTEWWYYHNTPMVFNIVPYYIIIAEALVTGIIPWFYLESDKPMPRSRVLLVVVGLGFLMGLSVDIFGHLGFYLSGH